SPLHKYFYNIILLLSTI
uniref:Uncharacterized protein n=1 Tax=Amphimedon queenslandica TaxID=400682 RepID=A0A1X7UWW0_AMPQE